MKAPLKILMEMEIFIYEQSYKLLYLYSRWEERMFKNVTDHAGFKDVSHLKVYLKILVEM